MSNPAPNVDLSATSPAALLGDPSAVQPPQIGVGSRGRRGKGAGGLLGRDWTKRSPRAPLSPQSRETARGAAAVIRPQPKEAPARQASSDDRPRTPAGAPAVTPRRIPKTGRTEQYRDAMTRVLGKDQRPQYYFMPADSQEIVNRIMRHTGRVSMKNYDIAGRQALQDDLDIMRGKRPRSKVAEAAARGESSTGFEPVLERLSREDAMREANQKRRTGKTTVADVGIESVQKKEPLNEQP